MFKTPLPSLLLAASLVLPAMALELADLHLPLTRTEADASLSKDYRFRVLEDLTVRRIWELENRTVSVDFSPKAGDAAILIFIDYGHPVTPEVAADDAAALHGEGQPEEWRRLLSRRAARLGMQEADGLKLEGGRYCFRELNRQGQVTRLAYYPGRPGEIRWALGDDERHAGKTAMGTTSTSGKSEFLWKEEARRLAAAPSAARSASAPEAQQASPAASEAAPPAAEKPASPSEAVAPIERPHSVAEDIVNLIEGTLQKLTPTHYAIAGGLLALLVVLRLVSNYLESRRRAKVTEYIMNRGQRSGKRPAKRMKRR